MENQSRTEMESAHYHHGSARVFARCRRGHFGRGATPTRPHSSACADTQTQSRDRLLTPSQAACDSWPQRCSDFSISRPFCVAHKPHAECTASARENVARGAWIICGGSTLILAVKCAEINHAPQHVFAKIESKKSLFRILLHGLDFHLIKDPSEKYVPFEFWIEGFGEWIEYFAVSKVTYIL